MGGRVGCESSAYNAGVSVPPHEITALLHAAGNGDRSALNHAFALVYQHLRGLAHAQPGKGQHPTLGTTALVNETYLKFVHGEALSLQSREHFFNLAARAMRQVLVDRARSLGAAKRPDQRLRISLDEESGAALPAVAALPAELIDLDRALDRLAAADARGADLVALHLFAGLQFGEIATLRGVSERTVLRDWRKTRAFLLAQLGA